MSLYVVKFGGSSVSSVARIKHVASLVAQLIFSGHSVVVVTSAMQGMTNQLIDLAQSFSCDFFDREYDVVVSVGEQIASGLIAIALNSLGVVAKSMVCWQSAIKTCGEFSDAFIESIDKSPIVNCLNKKITPVVAGFQGLSEKDDVMTIGRGGSDATACAVSYAIGADECFIYTDVDGIYTADPRIVLGARRILSIAYDEMLEMASSGAKVLQSKSVLMAKKCNVKLRVLSSFCDSGTALGATMVSEHTTYIPKEKQLAGISHNTNMAKVSILTRTFLPVDVLNQICQDKNKVEFVSFLGLENESMSFLIPKLSANHLKPLLEKISGLSFEIDNDIGVVTLVGSGIKTDKDILSDVVCLLSERKIVVKQMSLSEISISIVVALRQIEDTVNVLHDFFFA